MPKKSRAKTLRLLYNIHLYLGLCLFLPFVIQGLTGVYLVFPQSVGSVFTDRDARSPIKVTPTEHKSGIDEIIAVALKSVPDSRVQSIMFPQKPDQAYRLNLTPKDSHDGMGATTVFVDQYQGKVALIKNPKDNSTGENILAWGRALHSGKAIGLVWKFVILFLGIAPLVFSVTGITLWLMKRRAKLKTKRT